MHEHDRSVAPNEGSLAAHLLPDVVTKDGVAKIIGGVEDSHAATRCSRGFVEVSGKELATPAVILNVVGGLKVSVWIDWSLDGF